MDTLAEPLEEAQDETLGDTLDDLEAETLVDLLAFKLAVEVAKALLHTAPDTLKEANHERLR